jgi:hypothetical protein
MSDGMIHPNNEITGLVPVNHHQHEESRKFQKRKKRDKDDESSADFPDEDVEDLLHRPEDEDAAGKTENQPPVPEEFSDGRNHLNLLL